MAAKSSTNNLQASFGEPKATAGNAEPEGNHAAVIPEAVDLAQSVGCSGAARDGQYTNIIQSAT